MNKLWRIPLAWFYWLINHNDKLAQYRTAICVKCDYLIKGKCNLCGCPIIAKSRLSDETCPHPHYDKWNPKYDDPNWYMVRMLKK